MDVAVCMLNDRLGAVSKIVRPLSLTALLCAAPSEARTHRSTHILPDMPMLCCQLPIDCTCAFRYILPSLSLVPTDSEESVCVEYAAALPAMAAAAHRFLERLQQAPNAAPPEDTSDTGLVSPCSRPPMVHHWSTSQSLG